MVIIDSIKDKLGRIIYPKTLTKAVYEEGTNKRLDLELLEKAKQSDLDITNQQLNEKADKTRGVWYDVTFVNGYKNFGGGYEPVQFMRDQFGMVYMRGLMNNDNSSERIAFTLPAGYRPLMRVYKPIRGIGGIGVVNISLTGVASFILTGAKDEIIINFSFEGEFI